MQTQQCKGKKRKERRGMMNAGMQRTQTHPGKQIYISYPVTPPEQLTLGFCEPCDMLFLKREKLYKRFLGRTTPTHPTGNNNNKQQVVCFNRAPQNWFCLVLFGLFLYTKTDQVNISIYIAECKGCSFDTPDLVQSP